MVTRAGEVDSRVGQLEDEIGTLREEVKELGLATEKRLVGVEATVTTLLQVMQNTITEQIQKGFAALQGGTGGSLGVPTNKETPPVVVIDSSPTASQGQQAGDRPSSSRVEEVFQARPLGTRKVELPAFDGDDPLTWIARAEQYFSIQATSPAGKVTIAMVSMDGAALNWVRWIGQQRLDFSWEELKAELVKRFMGTQATNRFEHLSLIKQKGSVDDFIDEIVACAAHTTGIGNDQLLGYFLAGIKPEIRVDLQRNEEVELFAAMDGARRVERKLNFDKGLGRGPWKQERSGARHRPWPNKGAGSAVLGSHGSKEGPFSKPKSGWQSSSSSSGSTMSTAARPVFSKTLTPRELSDLRAKGLCFKCRQPYSPLHKCGEKIFKLVEFLEEELDDTEADIELVHISGDDLEVRTGDKGGTDLQWLELPLNKLGGSCNSRALKTRARLRDRKVVVLVDSGASHNFINCRIVEVEELAVESTGTFGVRLGNGQKVETREIYRRLPLQFGLCEMAIDCYPFDLGGIDLVLGYAWLLSMKRTTVDWEALTVEFEQEDQAGACHKVLVAWEGKPLEEATWMTCADFRAQFPLSNLADKVCSIGGATSRAYEFDFSDTGQTIDWRGLSQKGHFPLQCSNRIANIRSTEPKTALCIITGLSLLASSSAE
ncbi:hypothetical protein V2J09_021502 [Rumex salicifolius]